MEVDDVFKYWLLQLLRVLLRLLDLFLDLILGTTVSGGTRAERTAAEADYGRSAHLVKVLWKAKHSIYRTSWLSDFIYKHQVNSHK